MIRAKRSDTPVSKIEAKHRIALNCRADTLLGNLLADRGFDSMTQLVRACRQKAVRHARQRNVFVSYHVSDKRYLSGFWKMASNPKRMLDLRDTSLRVPIRSQRNSYVRQEIAKKIKRASVVICLIGHGTGWRNWVDWEIEKAFAFRKGVIGVRIPRTKGRRPQSFVQRECPVFKWGDRDLVAGIEWAAATRS
jgi:hypothetical protein